MALKISNLAADERTVSFVYAGEDVTIVYRPSKFTPSIAAAAEGVAEQEVIERLVGRLADMLVRWDVLDDDGSELPTSEDVIRELPFRFLNTIIMRVAEDSRPEASSGRSNDG